MTDALHVGERIKEAAKGHVRSLLGDLPLELAEHDQDGCPLKGDLHPFYLSEDADDDGFIDHVVMHVPQGLQAEWRWALEEFQPAAGSSGPLPPFGLRADWIGNKEMQAQPGRLLGPARIWRSATPYVPNIHLKRRPAGRQERQRLTKALVDDLRKRGFLEPDETPMVEKLSVLDDGLQPRCYATVRSSGEQRQAKSRHPGAAFRIVFSREIWWPLTVGFACHLGLGLFRHEGGLLDGGSRGGRPDR